LLYLKSLFRTEGFNTMGTATLMTKSLRITKTRCKSYLIICKTDYTSIGTSEGGLHQRLEVSGAEDASRVRNAILVPGILRRSAVSLYDDWSRSRKNLRQSTFKDYHDKMNKFNNGLATVNSTRA